MISRQRRSWNQEHKKQNRHVTRSRVGLTYGGRRLPQAAALLEYIFLSEPS